MFFKYNFDRSKRNCNKKTASKSSLADYISERKETRERVIIEFRGICIGETERRRTKCDIEKVNVKNENKWGVRE